MIKVEAKIIGTVKRSASIRTDKNNNPYLSLILAVNLPDAKSNCNSIDVFVSLPLTHQDEAQSYVEGLRLMVSGILDIRKKDEELKFYLSGNAVTTQSVTEHDSISGSLSFRGYLKKENIYEQKTDKNGHPFIFFSAYSLEKSGQDYISTWINFMRFPEKGADIATIIPECFRSKAHLDITGDIQVSSYNGVVRLSCRVKEMAEHVDISQ